MLSPEESNPTLDSIRLLEETHDFPCEVMIKVIGHSQATFVEAILEIVRECQSLGELPAYRSRSTPNGKYIAITLEPPFQSAAEVLALYERIRVVQGVVMVM